MRKKKENKLPTGSAATSQKDDCILRRLSFLADSLETAPTIGNIAEPDNDDTTQGDGAIDDLIREEEANDGAASETVISPVLEASTSESQTVAPGALQSTPTNSATPKRQASPKKSPFKKRASVRDRAFPEFQKQSKERLDLMKSFLETERNRQVPPMPTETPSHSPNSGLLQGHCFSCNKFTSSPST
nr:PREDICTED: uncharacterized protein LOC109042460 [Bemisia tabaci]